MAFAGMGYRRRMADRGDSSRDDGAPEPAALPGAGEDASIPPADPFASVNLADPFSHRKRRTRDGRFAYEQHRAGDGLPWALPRQIRKRGQHAGV